MTGQGVTPLAGAFPHEDVVEVSVNPAATRDKPAALTLDDMAELLARADRLGISRSSVVLFGRSHPDGAVRVRVTQAGVRALVHETALRPSAPAELSAAQATTDQVGNPVCQSVGCGHVEDIHLTGGGECTARSCPCPAWIAPDPTCAGGC